MLVRHTLFALSALSAIWTWDSPFFIPLLISSSPLLSNTYAHLLSSHPLPPPAPLGDLNPDVTEALLFETFNNVGPVASVRVCRDAATRRSLGYAYVNFHRAEDAERALDTMNFAVIRGRACRIMWSHRDPSQRKNNVGNIFVKNLDKSIDNKTLFDTFSVFGSIASCKVATNAEGESLGYGFVHYAEENDAQAAIEKVNGKEIGGKTVTVQAFRSRDERGGSQQTFTNLYVKNLPEEYTEEQLTEMFAPHGEITSLVIQTDAEGKSRGFGFVSFQEPEQAAAAVEALNNKDFGEKKLFVGRAQKRSEREKELRDRMEQMKLERQKKFAGVNLYVKNLADNIDKDRLIAEFASFGDITSAKIMIDEAGKSRGFGFVCFSTPEEATKAVTDMNGKMLEGKPLYVALAQRKEVRRAHLEAQYAARAKMGVPQPMYPQGPMFYPQMNPRMMYQPQMNVRGRWQQGQQRGPNGAPMMQGMPVNYMNVLPGGRGQQPRGGRGQQQPNQQVRQQGKGKSPQAGSQGAGRGRNQNQQQGFKYTAQARNAGDATGNATLAQELAQVPEDQRKQMIGERLFPLIHQKEPELAGKITGMLLEMDNGELLHLLEVQDALHEKIDEALEVLKAHEEPEAAVAAEAAN